MNQPACDLTEAIAGRFPADKRADVISYLEAVSGREPDQFLTSAEYRDRARRIEAGRRLVKAMVESRELTEVGLLRETALDL